MALDQPFNHPPRIAPDNRFGDSLGRKRMGILIIEAEHLARQVKFPHLPAPVLGQLDSSDTSADHPIAELRLVTFVMDSLVAAEMHRRPELLEQVQRVWPRGMLGRSVWISRQGLHGSSPGLRPSTGKSYERR